MLARAKSNISDDQGGVGYLVETCTVGDGLETTRVLWGDRIEGSAREILADVESTGDGDGRSELDEACDFLRALLADGAVPTKRIKADADGAGHAWATVRRAQKVVGAEAIRIGEEGRKGGGTWYWELSCSSPLEHLKRRQPEHVNETQKPRGFQPYEDDTTELSCSGNTVSALIENLVIGPEEEGF